MPGEETIVVESFTGVRIENMESFVSEDGRDIGIRFTASTGNDVSIVMTTQLAEILGTAIHERSRDARRDPAENDDLPPMLE